MNRRIGTITFSFLLYSFFVLAMEQEQQGVEKGILAQQVAIQQVVTQDFAAQEIDAQDIAVEIKEKERSDIVVAIKAIQREKPIVLVPRQNIADKWSFKESVMVLPSDKYFLLKPKALVFSKFLQSQIISSVIAGIPAIQSHDCSRFPLVLLDQKIIVIDLTSEQIACAVNVLNNMELLLAQGEKILLSYIIQQGEFFDLSYIEMLFMLDFFGIDIAFDLFIQQSKPEFSLQDGEEERAQNQEIRILYTMIQKMGIAETERQRKEALWAIMGYMLYPGCNRYPELQEVLSYIIHNKSIERIVLAHYLQQHPILFRHTQYALRGHTEKIVSMEFDQDDAWLSTKSCDQSIRVWDMYNGSLLQARLSAAGLWDMWMFNNNNTIFAGITGPAKDCSRSLTTAFQKPLKQVISIFRTIDKSLLCTIDCPEGQYVMAMAVNDSASLIAIGLSNRTVQIFDLTSGKTVYTYDGFNSFCTAIAFDSYENNVVIGTGDGLIRLMDIKTGAIVRMFNGRSDFYFEGIVALSYSFDGAIIASARVNGGIDLWDSFTGKLLFSIPQNRSYEHIRISSLQWNHGGTLLAVAFDNGDCLVLGYDSLLQTLSCPMPSIPDDKDIYSSLEEEAKPFIMDPYEADDIIVIPDPKASLFVDIFNLPLLPAKHSRS